MNNRILVLFLSEVDDKSLLEQEMFVIVISLFFYFIFHLIFLKLISSQIKLYF